MSQQIECIKHLLVDCSMFAAQLEGRQARVSVSMSNGSHWCGSQAMLVGLGCQVPGCCLLAGGCIGSRTLPCFKVSFLQSRRTSRSLAASCRACASQSACSSDLQVSAKHSNTQQQQKVPCLRLSPCQAGALLASQHSLTKGGVRGCCGVASCRWAACVRWAVLLRRPCLASASNGCRHQARFLTIGLLDRPQLQASAPSTSSVLRGVPDTLARECAWCGTCVRVEGSTLNVYPACV
jgi:hypothetical protein